MHRMHFHACCGRLMYLKICTSRFNEIPQYLKYLAVRYNKHCRRHPAGWTVHHVQDPGLLHGRLVQYTIGLSGFYHCVIIWTYSTVITLPMTPNCDHHAVITLPMAPHLTTVLWSPCGYPAAHVPCGHSRTQRAQRDATVDLQMTANVTTLNCITF